MRRSDQRRDAVFACYQREVTDRPLTLLIADARPFTAEIAKGVESHREGLDRVISEFARGWELGRIAPLEKNIMRVALYEMKYRDDVPFEVAIDEAVITAKKFCGAEAPGFVNGILGSAARAMGADASVGAELPEGDEIDVRDAIEVSEIPEIGRTLADRAAGGETAGSGRGETANEGSG